MKRKLFPLILAAAVAGVPLPATAQNSTTAAVIAERQEAEERYKRMNSAVEDLLAAQAAMQKRLAALADELREVRAELAAAKNAPKPAAASPDDLQKLADAIKEIDQKRDADKKLILAEIKKLAGAPAAAASQKPAVKETEAAAPKREKGWEHVIEKGETLSTVIAAYNDALKAKGAKGRVTLSKVLEANPGLKPERLKVGEKVFIPEPAE